MTEIQGIGLVLLVFSALLTLDQLYTLLQAHRSAKWPQTRGRIIESSVAPVSLKDRLQAVQPLIRYRYTVDAVEYVGQTLSIGEGWWGFSKTRFSIQDEFPRGGWVSVFYNPSRPGESALMVGTSVSTYLRPVAAALFVMVALKLLLS